MTDLSLHEKLIGLVYDAALDRSLWPDVVAGVTNAVGGRSAALLYQDQTDLSGTAVIWRLDPASVDDYYKRYAPLNPYVKNNLAVLSEPPAPRMRTIVDTQLLPKEDLLRTEYYNDFARPYGIHTTIMIGLAFRDMKVGTLNIMRPPGSEDYDQAEVDLAKALQPHLIRAFTFALEIERLRAQETAWWAALEKSETAFVLADANGTIRCSNRGAERLLARQDALCSDRGKVAAPGADATRQLLSMIARATSPEVTARKGGAMVLPCRSGARGCYLSAVPVDPSKSALFNPERLALLRITDPDAELPVNTLHLRDLFGLSHAEARIAMKLLADRDPAQIAAELGQKISTVRFHLQNIFRKTQITRQSELIRLLMRVIDHLN
jgi:DNA-binding CsgD family transcriptional regulator